MANSYIYRYLFFWTSLYLGFVHNIYFAQILSLTMAWMDILKLYIFYSNGTKEITEVIKKHAPEISRVFFDFIVLLPASFIFVKNNFYITGILLFLYGITLNNFILKSINEKNVKS